METILVSNGTRRYKLEARNPKSEFGALDFEFGSGLSGLGKFS